MVKVGGAVPPCPSSTTPHSLTIMLLPLLLLLLTCAQSAAAKHHHRPPPPPPAPPPPARNRTFPNINFSFRPGRIGRITPSKNISRLLDSLLEGYDQKLRPNLGGEPTTVEIDIEVRSMSQISEMDMTYSMDCYFRQSWVDARLAFSDLDQAITLSVSVLDKLWKPDTFIYNGKRSYVHLITTPNKFIRLYQNGRILYSSRLTIHANCPMNLQHFPMDTQRCPLQIGSFAYTTRDVMYRWNKARQVVIADDLMLSQFDIIAIPSSFENTTRRAGEFSTLLAAFHLQRHMGNFLITVYGPCVLLVVLSWVSFWLNREATSDRISLGITTVLTMTFLGLEARTDLPKVPYSTALDLFVWLSYGFIFATIIEFAFVHVFTKVGSGEVYLSQTSSEIDSDEEDEDLEEGDEEEEEEDEEGQREAKSNSRGSLPLRREMVLPLSPLPLTTTFTPSATITSTMGPNGVGGSSRPSLPLTPSTPSLTSRIISLCGRSKRGTRYFKGMKEQRLQQQQIQHHFKGDSKEKEDNEREGAMMKEKTWRQERRGGGAVSRKAGGGGGGLSGRRTMQLQANSVSNLDEISRVLFPLAFLAINFLYWYTYLSQDPWPANHL